MGTKPEVRGKRRAIAGSASHGEFARSRLVNDFKAGENVTGTQRSCIRCALFAATLTIIFGGLVRLPAGATP